MREYPRFLLDASLALAAKWLRIMGYDSVVFPGKAGRQMMRQAAAENRIILTRRQDMLARQFSGTLYLVCEKELMSQLKGIMTRFSLKIDKRLMFTICLSCNEKLLSLAKEEVQNLVPPYVFAHFSDYNRCPRCRKIYWPGTHTQNSMLFLKRMLADVV